MQLDAPTLLLVTAILTFMVGSLFLLSWSQARHVRALALWGVAHLTGAGASVLLGLRGVIPDWASIGGANGVMLGSYGLIWAGTRAFEGRAVRWGPIAAAVALWAGGCLIPAFYGSLPARVMLASALGGGFCFSRRGRSGADGPSLWSRAILAWLCCCSTRSPTGSGCRSPS